MSQTNQQKAIQIVSALALPEGHYAVQVDSEGQMVGQVELPRPSLMAGDPPNPTYTDRWMNIYVSTAVWFQLYESTDSGIVWTLCLPDPQNQRTRCTAPRLEYELLGITIVASYSKDGIDPESLSDLIKDADKIDDIPALR